MQHPRRTLQHRNGEIRSILTLVWSDMAFSKCETRTISSTTASPALALVKVSLQIFVFYQKEFGVLILEDLIYYNELLQS